MKKICHYKCAMNLSNNEGKQLDVNQTYSNDLENDDTITGTSKHISSMPHNIDYFQFRSDIRWYQYQVIGNCPPLWLRERWHVKIIG